MKNNKPEIIDRLESELKLAKYSAHQPPLKVKHLLKSQSTEHVTKQYEHTWHLDKNKQQNEMVTQMLIDIEQKELEKRQINTPKPVFESAVPVRSANEPNIINVATSELIPSVANPIQVTSTTNEPSTTLPNEHEDSPMDIDDDDDLEFLSNVKDEVKESLPTLINIDPPSCIKSDSELFSESFEYYSELIKYNKSIYAAIKQDKPLKNRLFKTKMAITKIIGQIQDDESNMQRSLISLKQHITDAVNINQPVFIMVLIGKLFIKQAQAECATHVYKSLPLAKVLVQLILNNKFKDFILSRLVKKCPGILIDKLKLVNNNNGIFALYTSLCIQSKQLNICWRWTANCINHHTVINDQQCLFLSTVIELAGRHFQMKYNKQALKLINCIIEVCDKLPHTPQSSQLLLMAQKSINQSQS